MSDGRFAILDPAAGISGDMLLGALVAAGAPKEWLAELPARMGCPEVTIELVPVTRCGVRATKVNVVLPGGHQELPSVRSIIIPSIMTMASPSRPRARWTRAITRMRLTGTSGSSSPWWSGRRFPLG